MKGPDARVPAIPSSSEGLPILRDSEVILQGLSSLGME